MRKRIVMQFKFDANLDYQTRAVEAVTNIFEGQSSMQSDFNLVPNDETTLVAELGISNYITLNDQQILANVHKIQEANNIKKTLNLQGWEFSVEMETGTGKTYVYLRTIFELSKKYGLKKFVIVVPSIAIREGVQQTIRATKNHFHSLYENEPFDYFVYDSAKLGRVRQFANSNKIQIMIINIQSFQRDAVIDENIEPVTEEELKKINIMNRESEKMSGYKPISFIQTVNPVVIIDEPQSVDNTEKAKKAIASLNPIFTLRYSATHSNPYNLMYKLDPIQAYDLRLVKRIEVVSVRADDDFSGAYVKLLKTTNRPKIKAQVEIHKTGKSRPVQIWVEKEDDLYVKSDERQDYENGYIVRNIDCTPGSEYIEFNNGEYMYLGKEIGGYGDDIMKEQIEQTVEQHLKKEQAMHDKEIKVLSLFFIDRVENYRIYGEGGATSLGKIGKWFEEAYEKLTKRPIYKRFSPESLGHDIAKIHGGYFSKDKSGNWKNSTERGNKDDNNTYNLIMREKERLLDPKESLRFIFSHSALREGWDNPNVFQICTLNESTSIQKKRQEIGRGLRLPVNNNGERVHDKNINRLAIIANESYEHFAKSLQKEIENDFGINFGKIEKIDFANIVWVIKDREEPIGQEESEAIWENLLEEGYISEDGEIQNKFDSRNPHFELKINKKYDDIKPNIIDEIQHRIFKNRVVNARERRELTFNKQVYLDPKFKTLWNKIKHRTRYSVQYDTKKLVEEAVERIKKAEKIKPVKISTTRVAVEMSEAGVSADNKLEDRTRETADANVLPDIMHYLQRETELTRDTLAEILKGCGRLGEFKINPQQFMTMTGREISWALQNLMLTGIKYTKIKNQQWEMERIKEDATAGIVRYLNNLYKVQNQKKSIFDAVEIDSEVEKQFAKDLDNNDYVQLFVKLPNWFTVDTPIGPYNPDWAFVTKRDKKLYFVRETKSTADSEELRMKENQKIECGKSHFETIGVDYDVVTKLSEVKF